MQYISDHAIHFRSCNEFQIMQYCSDHAIHFRECNEGQGADGDDRRRLADGARHADDHAGEDGQGRRQQDRLGGVAVRADEREDRGGDHRAE